MRFFSATQTGGPTLEIVRDRCYKLLSGEPRSGSPTGQAISKEGLFISTSNQNPTSGKKTNFSYWMIFTLKFNFPVNIQS
jgi:hypothetical protein